MASRILQASYDTECDNCSGWIWQGDDFRFDKDDKICSSCWA